jgi:hypothetical protein
MTAFAFAITPKRDMISYCEALIVCCLFHYSKTPDEKEAIPVVSNIIQQNVGTLETQHLVFASNVEMDRIACYSKSTNRRIEKSVALDMLAQENTSDILIHAPDLLYGGQYASNYLPGAIDNAKTIITRISLNLEECSEIILDSILQSKKKNDGTTLAGKGITKNVVISAFSGLHFDGDQWSKYTATPPDWLKNCRVERGNKKTSALWNPVDIAIALLDKKVKIKQLDPIFVDLEDWMEEWKQKSSYFRN